MSQYKGVSLNQNIQIAAQNNRAGKKSDPNAYLDGVTKATASVRIINQSVLASALKVARKKLGFAEGRDPELIARVKPDLVESHSAHDLIDSGLVRHVVGEFIARGTRTADRSWMVGVQDPRHADGCTTVLQMDGRSVATSGDYETTFSRPSSHFRSSYRGFSARTGQ